MRQYYYVKPSGGDNLCKNPEFANGTIGWAINVLNPVTYGVNDDYQLFGDTFWFSINGTLGTNAILSTGIDVEAGKTYYLSAYINVVNSTYNGDSLYLSADNGTNNVIKSWVKGTHKYGGWVRILTEYTPNSTGSTFVRLYTGGTNINDGVVRVDGVMISPDYDMLYFNGDYPGCFWAGEPHNSTSHSGGGSSIVGELMPLDDEGIKITGLDESGLNSRGGRNIDITIDVYGDTYNNMASRRSELIAGLNWAIENGHPVRFIVEDDDFYRPADIYLDYLSGGELTSPSGFAAKLALRFRMSGGGVYGLGYGIKKTALNNKTSVGQTLFIHRDADGNIARKVTSSNQYAFISDIKYSAVDNKLYIGGNFTDFDGLTGGSYIVKVSPNDTSDKYLVGAANAINDIVHGIEIWGDKLIIYGEFTNAGGITGNDYITLYDIASDTYTKLSPSGKVPDNHVYTACLLDDGRLFIGGAFNAFGGVSVPEGVCFYDPVGDSITAINVGVTGTVSNAVQYGDKIVFKSSATLYVCDMSGNLLSSYEVGDYIYTFINDIINYNGYIYIGGNFDSLGGMQVNKLAIYNGKTILPVGDNDIDHVPIKFVIDDNGNLTGSFQYATSSALFGGLFEFDGYKFRPKNMLLFEYSQGGTLNGYTFLRQGGIQRANSYYGFNRFPNTADLYISKPVTVTVPRGYGTVDGYLVITTGDVPGRLYSVINDGTGESIVTDVSMAPKKTVLINDTGIYTESSAGVSVWDITSETSVLPSMYQSTNVVPGTGRYNRATLDYINADFGALVGVADDKMTISILTTADNATAYYIYRLAMAGIDELLLQGK